MTDCVYKAWAQLSVFLYLLVLSYEWSDLNYHFPAILAKRAVKRQNGVLDSSQPASQEELGSKLVSGWVTLKMSLHISESQVNHQGYKIYIKCSDVLAKGIFLTKAPSPDKCTGCVQSGGRGWS